MNIATRLTPDILEQQIAQACSAIAPVWPLDQFIAVNPFHGHTDQSVTDSAAKLGALSGAELVMDADWFRRAWQQKRFTRSDIEQVIADNNAPVAADDLIGWLEESAGDNTPEPLPLLSDLAALFWEPAPGMSWRAHIQNHISRFCALYFDQDEADWQQDRDRGLYREWLAHFQSLRGRGSLSGHPALRGRAGRLPEDAGTAIHQMVRDLEVPPWYSGDYLLALLLSVNGWASWCAGQAWRARQDGGEDGSLVELLAIRLAWDWLLDDLQRGPQSLHSRWQNHWRDSAGRVDQFRDARQHHWLGQLAMERAWQRELGRKIRVPGAGVPEEPGLQAVFCIDVRSEVFRRHLEACDPGIETLGFAGFFGLPVAYRPAGATLSRPQLPGLLAPALEISETGEHLDSVTASRQQRLAAATLWKKFEYAPASIFTLVESLGPFYAGKLAARSLALGGGPGRPDHAGLTGEELKTLRPALTGTSTEEETELAAGILKAMGLTEGFAPLVLLVGHGSQSANNPHAACLDCGACCGQAGDLNARVLAGLLNDEAVRDGLKSRGIRIPEETSFVPALHNTTTDQVTLLDTESVPARSRERLEQAKQWLAAAGNATRAERAPGLGLEHLSHKPEKLEKALKKRARDWGQLRPEWGLANNAAFIAAPRSRTRGQNLRGRVFLHDYHWQSDDSFETLRQILTGPLVVAHWINMQYYASTVDNQRYGSGNKTLHNVVGGRIGVLEGNGGDLRIGLPWQSLHDGEKLVHEPLRLTAFVEAPDYALNTLLAEEEQVQDLVENGWLHLIRIDSETGSLEQYREGNWKEVSGA